MYQHFLSIQELSKAEIIQILDDAQAHLEQTKQLHIPITPQDASFSAEVTRDLNYFESDAQLRTLRCNGYILAGKWVVNAFFEPSTRTRCSFEIAAKRLGAEVLNLDISNSSVQKGEEILDTFKNLEAMGCDVLVIRHAESGMVKHLAEQLKTAVINAGDGQNEHPTQAVLDMLTIRQHKANFPGLSVAIVGDIAHSRVARSDIFALQTLGVKDIRVIAPTAFLPKSIGEFNVRVFDNLSEGLDQVDVIITLRIQKERMLAAEILNINVLYQTYKVTQDTLAFAKPDVIVLHPGPLNRGVEITSEVADGPDSVILQQAKNGVAARMAVFAWLFSGGAD